MNNEKVNPKYVLRTVPLPQPPGVPNLPPRLFFYIDNRFSQRQMIRIRNLIVFMTGFWEQHYVEKAASGISRLAACTDKYAERNLTPVWFKGIPFTSGADALNYAMDVLSFRFRENGFRKVKSIIKYHVPRKGEQSTIFAKTSYKIKETSLSVRVNPLVIDDQTIGNLKLTGSLFHAWLHRCGYDHPRGVYTSYLIAEAPMCLMRGFQDKVPGELDSLLTQFLD